MSKMERLNASVAQLLAVAVHEVLDVVGQAVSEYQEETARTRRENDSLKRRVRELQEALRRTGGGAALPLSLSAAEGRSPAEEQHGEQEWSSGLREEAELAAEEEKGEFLRLKRSRWREEEPGRPESERSADSEAECDALGPTGAPRTSDAPHAAFASHGLKNDVDLDSIHAACLPSKPSPGASNPATLPGLSSDEIKMESESEPPECSVVEQHSVRIPFYEYADSMGGPARDEPAPDPYRAAHGPAYVHPERGTAAPKRFRFGKAVRSLPDGKKHRPHKRKEEQHICFLCGKTFSRVANLRIHQRCHTGEKPYCCMQCGRCFSQAGDLKKHKRVHTGEKPYHCAHCGKSFSRGENLKRHQKTHVGDSLLV
ncbi:zinc finger protein 79 [Anguilla anguilla]|uniref:zinc finger protein 79 n=1 Tax=Anguilla anguilla TaxID=7936 RepID=UPI0015B0ACE2|nr:zinc finger protein 79 [Anguilla anguilla]XP_035254851.1 zinc finger protein 79 [Anguilla anguilla]